VKDVCCVTQRYFWRDYFFLDVLGRVCCTIHNHHGSISKIRLERVFFLQIRLPPPVISSFSHTNHLNTEWLFGLDGKAIYCLKPICTRSAFSERDANLREVGRNMEIDVCRYALGCQGSRVKIFNPPPICPWETDSFWMMEILYLFIICRILLPQCQFCIFYESVFSVFWEWRG